MKVEQFRWTQSKGWEPGQPEVLGGDAALVLLFGSREILVSGTGLGELRRRYPNAHVMGCSTAGEIYRTQVTDDGLVATAIQFAHTRVKGLCVRIGDAADSNDAGARLARSLDPDGLVHVFVLS